MYTDDELNLELDWEHNMIDRGTTRFLKAQEDRRNKGRGDDTSAGRSLIKHYIKEVSAGIREFIEGKRHASDVKVMRLVHPDIMAMMAMKVLLGELHNMKHTLASCAEEVGRRVEDELMMRSFDAENKELFGAIMRRLDNSSNETYKRKAMMASMNTAGHGYTPWEPLQRYRVGARIIHIALQHCDLFEITVVNKIKGGGTYVRPTQACLDWIKDHDDSVSIAFPDRMPMLVKPEPWSSVTVGGYIHPHLRRITPMIIRHPLSYLHGSTWADMYNAADMPAVYRALNAIQATAWTINYRVLEVARTVVKNNIGIGMPQSEPFEFPKCPIAKDVDSKTLDRNSPEYAEFTAWKSASRTIHHAEAERKAKLVGALRTIQMASEMQKHDRFYFVYRQDFRGRIYSATTGLSPQGSELSKSLLKFSIPKKLGESGWYWLKVAGANRYGIKGTFDERVAKIDDMADAILAIATDPISYRELWQSCDEPYQFLAFAFEFAEAYGNPSEYRSHLPVGMDGSCNGLQHFSAMLKDEIGGRATNLVPLARPADIYQTVGDKVTAKLNTLADSTTEAYNWVKVFEGLGLPGCPRSLPKPPVMTLPYGSTERTCTDSIMSWITSTASGRFPERTDFHHAVYLTPLMWTSIGETVVAARAAMKWIRTVSRLVAKQNRAMVYTSPLGFPVRQFNEKFEKMEIKTHLGGQVRIKIGLPTTEIDSLKMQNGAPPNFVHHCDATHLMMSVNAMLDDGITSFMMVHDEYATHAADVEKMHGHIRKQFVKLYTEYDVLQRLHDEITEATGLELPPIPARGTLDLKAVENSTYFFA